MTMIPNNNRRRNALLNQLVASFIPWTPQLLRGGAQMARAAWDTTQMRNALPAGGSSNSAPRPPRLRIPRRPRGQRKRAPQPSAGPSVGTNSAMLRVKDTEYLGLIPKGFKTFAFNPGNSSTPRLAAFEKMYTRYRVHNMLITYVPSTSTYSTENVAYGVASGPVNADIKDSDTIMRLKPAHMRPAYITSNIRIAANIMAQPWLYCSDDTRDGVAFVLYVNATGANLGHFTLTYDLELTNPRPFS
ncbi:MAG: capsid protein [Tombusviridae sp.]|nr:MAG: capsid protein [Tombusviridae sp.]